MTCALVIERFWMSTAATVPLCSFALVTAPVRSWAVPTLPLGRRKPFDGPGDRGRAEHGDAERRDGEDEWQAVSHGGSLVMS